MKLFSFFNKSSCKLSKINSSLSSVLLIVEKEKLVLASSFLNGLSFRYLINNFKLNSSSSEILNPSKSFMLFISVRASTKILASSVYVSIILSYISSRLVLRILSIKSVFIYFLEFSIYELIFSITSFFISKKLTKSLSRTA